MRRRLYGQPRADVPRHRAIPRRNGIVQDYLRRTWPKAEPGSQRQHPLRILVANLPDCPRHHPTPDKDRYRQLRNALQIQALWAQTRTQTLPRPLPNQSEISKGQQGTRRLLFPSHRFAALQRQSLRRTCRLQLPARSHRSTYIPLLSPKTPQNPLANPNTAPAELNRTLQSLACAKLRPLTKHPKGREIAPTDTFTLNTSFSDAKYRIKINTVQLKETAAENKETHERVAADRNYETQAAIVRILKARKRISHAELVAETIKATRTRGTLEVSGIKRNIDRLIEKEFLEREDDGLYAYIA